MIEFRKITKTFNKGKSTELKLYDNLDLKINKGDFICLIGANGSGKSTLLNILCGTEAFEKGEVIVNNQDIKQIASFHRFKNISRVYQDPSLGTAPNLTVYENLALAFQKGKLFNLKLLDYSYRNIITTELKKLNMGMENKADVLVKELSGGQRQALALLMAMINEPEILLLDEHTAALDPKSSAHIMALTHRMVSERNLTTIMVTHNLEDALKYGNRIVQLGNGGVLRDITGSDKKTMDYQALNKKFVL